MDMCNSEMVKSQEQRIVTLTQEVLSLRSDIQKLVKDVKEMTNMQTTTNIHKTRTVEINNSTFVLKDKEPNNTCDNSYLIPSHANITQKEIDILIGNKVKQQQAFWTVEECILTFDTSLNIYKVIDENMHWFLTHIAVVFNFIDVFVEENLQTFNVNCQELKSNLSTMQYMESVHQEAYRKLAKNILEQKDQYWYSIIDNQRGDKHDVNPEHTFVRNTNSSWESMMKLEQDLIVLSKNNDIDYNNSNLVFLQTCCNPFNTQKPRLFDKLFMAIQEFNKYPDQLRFIAFTLLEVQLLSTFTTISVIAKAYNNNFLSPITELNELVNIDETIHVNNACFIIKEIILKNLNHVTVSDIFAKTKTIANNITDAFIDLFAIALPTVTKGVKRDDIIDLYRASTCEAVKNMFGNMVSDYTSLGTATIKPELLVSHKLSTKNNFFERKGTYIEMGYNDLLASSIPNDNQDE